MMARDIVGGTALHAAAGAGATKCVERLLQMDVLGRLLFAEDSDGAVPLHYAAASGHVGVMKALLSAYAQRVGTVDPRDRFGTRGALPCVAALRPAGKADGERAARKMEPRASVQAARRCT